MNMNDYQDEVEKLILTTGRDRLLENTLGLVGEAGEVAEKVKKWVRDDYLEPSELRKELGDVLFYVAALANVFGFSLDSVAKKNLEKLFSRQARGTLQGSGDNR